MTLSLTVVAVPALAAEGFAWQAFEVALLVLRAAAWLTEGLPTVAQPTVAQLGAAGIILIAEPRSVPQP
jgi:hypothetical protein